MLGSLLLDPEALSNIRESLPPEAFYHLPHRDVYRAIISLADSGKQPDAVLVDNMVTSVDRGDLRDMLEAPTTAANIEHYAHVVGEHYQRRRLLRLSVEAAAAAEPDSDPGALARALMAEAGAIVESAHRAKAVTLATLVDKVSASLRHRADHREEGVVLTGLHGFDGMMGGLHPGRLYVLAGTPGGGKTSLATWMLCAHCVHRRQPGMFFSAEMSASDVIERIVQQLAGIDGESLMLGRLDTRQREAWRKWADVLAGAPLLIDDEPNVDIDALVPRAHQAVADKGVSFIVVDYLQLLGARGVDQDNIRVSQCAGKLKALARQANVPVLLLSQITMTEYGPRARWSRDIEHIADAMVFIQRDEAVERQEKGEPDIVEHTYRVTKHRFGRTGEFTLTYNKPLMSFTGQSGWELTGPPIQSELLDVDDDEIPF